MAAAVILWSPVIIVTRMPPAWHSFDRLDRFLARRIEQADQAEQHQVLRQVGRAEAARLQPRVLEPGEAEHALALARELVRDLLEVLAVDRRGLAVRDLLAVAMLQDDLRRALDEQHLLAVGSLGAASP